MALSKRTHALRIIGGHWRGRRIDVATAEGLRPTPDRIRETVFNWLAPRIEGARCLDLFAGTGALGLEALSRGAGPVTFIERDRSNARALEQTLQTLHAQQADVIQADALTHARALTQAYDVIFVDPPFDANLHAAALAAITPLTHAHTRIYLEYPADRDHVIAAALPSGWRQLRDKRAGRVGYSIVCAS